MSQRALAHKTGFAALTVFFLALTAFAAFSITKGPLSVEAIQQTPTTPTPSSEPSINTPSPLAKAPKTVAKGQLPTSIHLPSFKSTAPVVPVKVIKDTLTPPDSPQTVGWWAQGAAAGSSKGSMLLVAHATSQGTPGFLQDIETLPTGAKVIVGTKKRMYTYTVTKTITPTKNQVASKADEFFRQAGKHRLVLITCDEYQQGAGWTANAIAFADLTKTQIRR